MWLAFRLEPTLAGILPRDFVTWMLRWYTGQVPGFLGTVVGYGPNASMSHVWLGVLPPGRSGSYT